MRKNILIFLILLTFPVFFMLGQMGGGCQIHPPVPTASEVTYDNSSSKLAAKNVQNAIDELDSNLDNINELEKSVIGEETLRIIRGSIDQNGKIVDGIGFTAERVNLGTYKVTFTNPFSSRPTITVTAESGTANEAMAAIGGQPDTISFYVKTWVPGTTNLLDRQFWFIAVGPR